MRDNINVNSSLKLFESYRDFGGGINTQQSNEMMQDNHVIIAENVDLAWTQSIKRRYGRSSINSLPTTDIIQGLFQFVNNYETILIVAMGGKLYYAQPSGASYGSWTQIPITDGGVSGFTFQTTDTIEAVQYGDWLYIATGTKLVRAQAYLNGSSVYTTAAETVVDQYKPSVQEALDVGLNALNTTPTAFLVDLNTSASNNVTALGIASDIMYPSIHTASNPTCMTLTAYRQTSNVTTPTNYTNVDYKWQYKLSSDTTWTSAPGNYGAYQTTPNSNKSYPVVLSTPGDYDFKVTMRLSADNSMTDEYTIFGVTVASTPQTQPITSTMIQRCRKCVLHWSQLILYDPKPTSDAGTSDERQYIFVSQVGNLAYFPASHAISFASDTQQRVRKIARYRNILLIFTPDTVQSLTGINFTNFQRSLINNQIGALWANSVQVVENQVFFVSKQGMYMINPNMYTQDNFNVISIDDHIKDQFSDEFIKSDAVAASGLATQQVVSAVHNNQYWLYSYGSSAKLYRYFYKTRSWVIDTFDHLGSVYFGQPITASYLNDQSLIEPAYRTVGATSSSVIMGEDKSVYTDLGIAYTMKLQTKYFDLSAAYNYKKLKRLYVLMRHFTSTTNLYITITADANVVLDPTTLTVESSMDANNAVTWNIVTETAPNIVDQNSMLLASGILGSSLLGNFPVSSYKTNVRAKARRISLTIQHYDGSPCEVYGFGLEFRQKRP